MDQGDRRIRKLRLVGSDSSLFTTARYRLAEAFRLASLPGLPPNALVLIRRLDLGEIRTDLPPWLLADRIENQVRELGGRAVCVDRQAAAAPVVWFSDPLQPFVTLLTQLLDNRPANEWYWQTLFAGKQPVLDSAGIELLLAGAAATPLKALGQSLLLQHCLAPARRRDRLLPLITRPMVGRLLHGLGLSLPAAGKSLRQPKWHPPAAVVARPGQPAGTAGPELEVPAPGVAALAPAAAAPRPAAIPAPDVGLTWRAALQWAARHWGAQDGRTLWLAWHSLLCHRPGYLGQGDILQRIPPADWLAEWSSPGQHTKPGPGSRPDAEDSTVGAKPQPAITKPDAAPSGEMPAGPANRTEKETAAPAVPTGTVADSPDLVPDSKAAAPQKESPVRPVSPTPHSPAAGAESSGTFSSHAGFALLIPLLTRLGMAELLARHEALVSLDFPSRLLAAFARRCGLAEDEPCRGLFAKSAASDNPVMGHFTAPAVWWRLAAAPDRPLRRWQSPDGGRHIITAAGSRWLLAAGDASTPGDPELLRQVVDHGSLLFQPVRFDDLVRAMQLTVGVYLRRYCRMSLRTLLTRPGRVVLTPTHWDVIFDLNQTDLRLRRVALDSDPGWVVWLGKVVQFHFR